MPPSGSYSEKPWLKSYEKGVPPHIDYERSCMPEFLVRSAERFADRTALIYSGQRVTYRQLEDMTNRFAACLADFGVCRRDAVAVLLTNSIPCVVAYFAILKIGAVAVLLNPLSSDAELVHQLNDSGSGLLVTAGLPGQRLVELHARTGVHDIIRVSPYEHLSFAEKIIISLRGKRYIPKGRRAKGIHPVHGWRQCMQRYQPDPSVPSCRFDDVAIYQYTGGITGVSKGVMLTQANLSTQVQVLKTWFTSFDAGREIVLGALPFFHVFGLTAVLNFAVYMGWTVILVPKPRPGLLLRAIRKHRPTFAPLVPTMYVGMMNHRHLDKTDMTCLRGCFSGSAPLPVEVIHDFETIAGTTIVEGFGMTETAPVTHINPFSGRFRKVGSVGIPLPDTECRIVDMTEGVEDMPVGERGELIIRGPQVMKGYRGMPGETAQALRDGWVYTGDIATMDEEGFFYIIDRKKDLIISGGYNIYPHEIEGVLEMHSKVREACAVGFPDRKQGELVKVFVVLKDGEMAVEDELIAYCRDKLARYKWPRKIEFRDELPKSATGEILRKELRMEELDRTW